MTERIYGRGKMKIHENGHVCRGSLQTHKGTKIQRDTLIYHATQVYGYLICPSDPTSRSFLGPILLQLTGEKKGCRTVPGSSVRTKVSVLWAHTLEGRCLHRLRVRVSGGRENTAVSYQTRLKDSFEVRTHGRGRYRMNVVLQGVESVWWTLDSASLS